MNMNKLQQPWTIISILYLFLLYFISTVPQSSCQSNSPQNIQTFYPFGLPPIASTPNTSSNLPLPPSGSPISPLPLPSPSPSPPSKSSSSSNKALVKAVVATAASTLVLSALFFFLLQRYTRRRRRTTAISTKINGNPSVVSHPRNDFVRFNGNLKGVIVDEEGLDVLYWRKLEGESDKEKFNKEEFDEKEEKKIISKGERSKKSKPPIQEIPLLRGKSSSSHVWPETVDKKEIKAVEKQEYSSIQLSSRSPPPAPSPPPVISSSTPPPPPPPMVPAKRSPVPPPKTGGLSSSLKPPPAPKGMPSDNKEAASSSEQGMTGNEKGQVKMKPLHWDKVNPNVEHSMVWDKVHGGSFRFDGDLMEALFGSVATNRKSPRRDSNMSSPKGEKSGPPSPIFILDTRKSQNIAIVLRSLAVSRKEIVDALIEGQGLDVDVLEKLTRLAPTKEEEAEILAFHEDHTRLADAESFLYHVLKAVPSAFTRFNAMVFRITYDSEIIHLKESLQTLESGCKELRTRGLFLKLLEAVLKAGNRMNAGTSRGNAQAFNLTSLRKLSDVKSTDGKTTLLHFVVEEVVRAEGKRCVINRNHSLKRSSSRNSNNYGSLIIDNPKPKGDREKEYIMFGLPVVGGISAEFSNVKKAASLEYDALQQSCSVLTDRVAEIRQLVGECAISGGGQGFIQKMKGFLDAAEGEIRVLREELTRIMELVKNTTDYYQAGASKDKGAQQLQLFVIVKDFLGMVDQVCVDITRNMQKRKTSTDISGSSSSPATRAVKFPLLPSNFMSEKSKSSSSDSEDDF